MKDINVLNQCRENRQLYYKLPLKRKTLPINCVEFFIETN